MNSVLDKEEINRVVRPMWQKEPTAASRLLIALAMIEIREAIEENTAVQKAIADRAGTIEEQGVEMLKGFDEIREDLQSQKDVVTELMKDMGKHARKLEEDRKLLAIHTGSLNQLAEEKQDRPEVLNGPDTARAGG